MCLGKHRVRPPNPGRAHALLRRPPCLAFRCVAQALGRRYPDQNRARLDNLVEPRPMPYVVAARPWYQDVTFPARRIETHLAAVRAGAREG